MTSGHSKGFCLLAVLILSWASACSKGTEEPQQEPQQQIPVSDSNPKSSLGNLTFAAPSEWIEESPSSPMRRAQYRLPRAAGDAEDAELIVFHFPGQGGSVQANMDRWVGQFSKKDGSAAADSAKISKRESANVPLTILDVEGTYSPSGGPMMQRGSPKPNYRMLAAIAETPAGPWFFKLTGQKSTLEKWEKGFLGFLDSIQPN
jgi:hypothetical protein